MSAQLSFESVGPMPLTDGNLFLNVQYTVTTPVGAITTQNLSLGNNTISVPAGVPTTVVIQPPSTNTQTLTLKGVNGDTGVPLHKTAPTFISLETTVTSFVLNAGGTINGVAFTWI